jgi:hypothetical protein
MDDLKKVILMTDEQLWDFLGRREAPSPETSGEWVAQAKAAILSDDLPANASSGMTGVDAARYVCRLLRVLSEDVYEDELLSGDPTVGHVSGDSLRAVFVRAIALRGGDPMEASLLYTKGMEEALQRELVEFDQISFPLDLRDWIDLTGAGYVVAEAPGVCQSEAKKSKPANLTAFSTDNPGQPHKCYLIVEEREAHLLGELLEEETKRLASVLEMFQRDHSYLPPTDYHEIREFMGLEERLKYEAEESVDFYALTWQIVDEETAKADEAKFLFMTDKAKNDSLGYAVMVLTGKAREYFEQITGKEAEGKAQGATVPETDEIIEYYLIIEDEAFPLGTLSTGKAEALRKAVESFQTENATITDEFATYQLEGISWEIVPEAKAELSGFLFQESHVAESEASEAARKIALEAVNRAYKLRFMPEQTSNVAGATPPDRTVDLAEVYEIVDDVCPRLFCNWLMDEVEYRTGQQVAARRYSDLAQAYRQLRELLGNVNEISNISNETASLLTSFLDSLAPEFLFPNPVGELWLSDFEQYCPPDKSTDVEQERKRLVSRAEELKREMLDMHESVQADRTLEAIAQGREHEVYSDVPFPVKADGEGQEEEQTEPAPTTKLRPRIVIDHNEGIIEYDGKPLPGKCTSSNALNYLQALVNAKGSPVHAKKEGISGNISRDKDYLPPKIQEVMESNKGPFFIRLENAWHV